MKEMQRPEVLVTALLLLFKSYKKRMCLCLFTALGCLSLLTACYKADNSSAIVSTTAFETVMKDMTCTVTVTDYFGVPVPNIEVEVWQAGEISNKKIVDEAGKVEVLLTFGEEYRIVLHNSQGQPYYYDEVVNRVNADTTEITIVLHHVVSDAREILAYSPFADEGTRLYTAYYVDEGSYYVPLVAGDRAYFVFRPSRPGIYRIYEVSGNEMTVGYYGSPINPMPNNLATITDGAIELEIQAYHIGQTRETSTPYVLALEAGEEAESGILVIEWIGDSQPSLVNQPWVTVLPDRELTPFKLGRGILTDLNLGDETLTVVFNEEDGYYHMGTVDGPLVLIRISSASPYVDAFTTMCDTGRLGAYQYDEAGNFLRKETFNELIAQYAAICDEESGVCPLDAQLAYMVQSVGKQKGWWAFDTNQHIFGSVTEPIPVEKAWLFACCYLQR